MKRVRLVAAALAVALTGGLLAGHAEAAETMTVVFTAGASVGGDVWAPGLGPDVATTYVFDTGKEGIGGQNFCVGVSSSKGADASCELLSTGNFGPVLGISGAGANCAFSSGKGRVDEVVINGTNVVLGVGMRVEWPAATGTILPLVLTKGNFAANGGQVIGQGAVQVTGAAPGTCGVGGPTREFEVTGYGVASF